MISETDLIVNQDGSIYHLGLVPEQSCDDVILIGDPDRMKLFTPRLDRIYFTHNVREFHSMMGDINGKRVLIISTGIGTDNIDIVMNELDALANVDFATREIKKKKRVLNFYRIGTSGALQEDIPVDSLLVSSYGIGLDVLMHYYQKEESEVEKEISSEVKSVLKKNKIFAPVYTTETSQKLLKKFKSKELISGCSITLPGFYGPQGRQVRIAPKSSTLLDDLKKINADGKRITNLEMETAGIYGLAKEMGHNAISFNAILANRATQKFSGKPQQTMERLIDYVLERI
jgi:uridine phosphorylase